MSSSKFLKNLVCFVFYIAFMVVFFDFKFFDGMTSFTKNKGSNSNVPVSKETDLPSKLPKDDDKNVIVLYSSERDDGRKSAEKPKEYNFESKAKLEEKPEVTITYGNKNGLSSKENATNTKKLSKKTGALSKPSPLDYIEAIKNKKWEYAELLDRYIVKYDADTYIVLTIRPKLQHLLENILAKYDTRMSAGVVQNPFTGEILAMCSSNKNQLISIADDDYIENSWALKATFPVASIFKIITSSAGMDTGLMNPNSNFLSDGKRFMKVWKAFANSHNGVFERMARQIGKDSIEEYAAAYGFNKQFYFDLPVAKSVMEFPVTQKGFEEAAAGLNKDFLISPIHVSQIVSTVVNKGTTMKPYLVDYVIRKSKMVFKRKPFALVSPIKPETAKYIRKMMHATTAVGTGKKGFSGYKTCPNLAKYCAGKTGTLTGSYPNYLFTWFGGYTTISGETLAITTLVGQSNHNSTKAPSVAGQLAYELFKIAEAEGTTKHGLVAKNN